MGLEPGTCRVRWAVAGDRPVAAAAHALARAVLAPLLGTDPTAVRWEYRCATCGGPHGRPFLVGGADKPRFSLSHAAGLVAVAVAAEPVGLDVEVDAPDLDPDELATVALTPAEQTEYAATTPAARAAGMLRTWTRKEAVLKADGRGLSVDPDAVRVSSPTAPPALLEWHAPNPPADAQVFDLELGVGRFGAVAILSPTPYRLEVGEHRW